jgi:3-hydroxy-3-methylglutaryl CoA synthase
MVLAPEDRFSGSTGITAIGVYVPRMRMERAAIAEAHGWMVAKPAVVRGFRSFGSWDEDPVTMAVEAGRRVLHDGEELRGLYLASTTLPFADLQNSAIVLDALGISSSVAALDVTGSRRAATSALIGALKSREPAIVLTSELLAAKPASAQEMSSGAAAAAIRLGNKDIIARCLSTVSRSALFVDSFRASDKRFDYCWEERWVRDEGYLGLVPECARAALQAAGIEPGAVSHFILPAAQVAIAPAVAKQIGLSPETCAPSHNEFVGFAGTADAFLSLADVLERAEPNQNILLMGFGQGVDAIVLRTTPLLSERKHGIGFRAAVEDRIEDSSYLRMLSFQGNIELEWGMRAEKDVKTALTEQYRSLPQVGGFLAGKCGSCGTVQFPQLMYCVNPKCAAPASGFSGVSLVDEAAKVFTFTADWLTYHAAPPLYVGFVQFGNGARVLMEIVDVGPQGLKAGIPLRMVYRIKDYDKLRGYKRYFWKATPLDISQRDNT